MLNNINSRGLSKSKRSQSLTILMQQVTSQRRNWKQPSKKTPKLTHVHAGTNDLTNNINNLRSVKKICEMTKKISPDTKIVSSSIIFQKDRRDIEKQSNDVNTRLKNLCKQKNLFFLFENQWTGFSMITVSVIKGLSSS